MNSILIAISWIFPWSALMPFMKKWYEYKEYSSYYWVYFVFFVYSLGWLLYNGSITGYLNYIFLFFLLIFRVNIGVNVDRVLVMVAYIIGIGLVVGFYYKYMGYDRVGLYGAEPNFSGLPLILFLMVVLTYHKYRLLGAIYVVLGLYITSSRTLALLALLSLIFYFIRNKQSLIYLFGVLFLVIYNNADMILSTLFEYGYMTRVGYVENYERLWMMADVSTYERLNVSYEWYKRWSSDFIVFLFGFTNNEFLNILRQIGLIAHNSFIQKGAEFGLLYVIVYCVGLFVLVRPWAAMVIFVYGFFLHNLWTIGVLCLMAILIPKYVYKERCEMVVK